MSQSSVYVFHVVVLHFWDSSASTLLPTTHSSSAPPAPQQRSHLTNCARIERNNMMEEPLLSKNCSLPAPDADKSNIPIPTSASNASPGQTNSSLFLHNLLADSRTEWSLRYTALHCIFYILFFYPPKTSHVNIDWSLPVQLISGGNLAFYNAGWSAWFGLGCAFAMV